MTVLAIAGLVAFALMLGMVIQGKGEAGGTFFGLLTIVYVAASLWALIRVVA